jgi:hypothetical protein
MPQNPSFLPSFIDLKQTKQTCYIAYSVGESVKKAHNFAPFLAFSGQKRPEIGKIMLDLCGQK